MFEGLREARRMNDPASNPLHWANRGWSDSRFSVIPGTVRKGPGTHPRAEFDLPLALFWTAVSGLDAPARRDLGGMLLKPRIPWAASYWPVSFCWRDGWIILEDMSSINNDSSSRYMTYYRPVRKLPNKRDAMLHVLRAPFPLTTDKVFTAFSTCSLGHVDDPAFMPPYNGRPSETMVSLMNSFRMKPGYIVWGGYLYVWVNILYWMRESRDLDFRHTVGAVSALEELELFRAYKVYYDQLRREVPAPYAGTVTWPDQCDPRFPLPGDPRRANYILA